MKNGRISSHIRLSELEANSLSAGVLPAFGERYMLKKIASACFSFLVFSGLFLAAQSEGFAQGNPVLTVRSYEELVQGYQSQGMRTPKNETEHQEISLDQGRLNLHYKSKLKETYLAIDEFYRLKKEDCNRKFLPKVKRSCVEAADAGLQKNGAKWLAALIKVDQIYNDRKRELREARKNFNPDETRRIRTDGIYNKRKKYERRKY